MGIEIGQILLWLGGQLVVGAAIWGGIRADLRNIREDIVDVRSVAARAHNRIDSHLEQRHTK